MPQGVKLTPGQYRLTTTNPPTTVVYTVDANGVNTTFGYLEWQDSGDGTGAYINAQVGLMFFADGTFKAMNGAQQIPGTYHRLS